MRTLLSLFVCVLVGCGGDSVPPDGGVTPPAQAASAPDERQRLAPDQLAAYLPEQVGTFQPVPDTYATGEVSESAGAMTWVQLDYKSPLNQRSGSGAYDVRVRITDARDWPARADLSHEFDLLGEGTTESAGERVTQRRTDGGWTVERVNAEFQDVRWEAVTAGRFRVEVNARGGRGTDIPFEDRVDLVRAVAERPPLAALADAPAYADAAPASGPPGWLSPAATAAPTLAFASCDAALPVAEVERACRVSGVRAVDTGMGSEGDCNRIYKRGDAAGGLVFLLSQFDRAETARRALGVAAHTDREDETRALPDLAGGGYSFVSETGEPRVAFVAGTALVELKASDSAFDAASTKLCLQRGQVEAVARSVADRITD